MSAEKSRPLSSSEKGSKSDSISAYSFRNAKVIFPAPSFPLICAPDDTAFKRSQTVIFRETHGARPFPAFPPVPSPD